MLRRQTIEIKATTGCDPAVRHAECHLTEKHGSAQIMAAGLRRAMNQFYILDDDEDAVWRCKMSQLDGTTITIAGLTAEGEIKLYTGVVQSLVHDAERDPDRRWRVTIYDGDTRSLKSA